MIDTSKIEDIELDGIDTNDYPDFCDAYISSASWKTGEPLNDKELDELNEDDDFVYQKVMDHFF